MEMTYAFSTEAARAEYAAGLTVERTGVEYAIRETEEVVANTTLYFLHVTRVSPTLKQLLTKREEPKVYDGNLINGLIDMVDQI